MRPDDTRTPRLSGRRFFTIAASSCLAALLVVVLVNALVDPHDTVGWAEIDGWTDRKIPDAPYGGRAALSLQLGHQDYRGVILGTSRERFGFAPKDPLLTERGIKNAALAGTNLDEIATVLDFAQEQQDLEIALIGLDFGAFRGGREAGGDFDDSLFAGRSPWAVQLGRLASGLTLQDSIRTVRASRTGQEPAVSEAAEFFEQSSGPAWNRFATSLLSYAAKHYVCFAYDPAHTERLGAVLQRAVAAGVEMILFFPPVHATQIEAIRAAGLFPAYQQWRRDVVDVVARIAAGLPENERSRVQLWDFSGYGPFTTEPIWKHRPSDWYFESAPPSARSSDRWCYSACSKSPRKVIRSAFASILQRSMRTRAGNGQREFSGLAVT